MYRKIKLKILENTFIKKWRQKVLLLLLIFDANSSQWLNNQYLLHYSEFIVQLTLTQTNLLSALSLKEMMMVVKCNIAKKLLVAFELKQQFESWFLIAHEDSTIGMGNYFSWKAT